MRVLFWTETFWPYIGGAEFFAAKLLPALRRRGYEFAVVTRHDDLLLPSESDFEGMPLYRFPFYQALADRKLDQVLEIRQQVIGLKRTFQPDLIHINCLGPSILFHLQTTRSHCAPYLVTLHGERYPPARGHGTLLARTLRAADGVTAPSEATAEYARCLAASPLPHLSVIHNGVEVPRRLPQPLPFTTPRLLCLGRLVAEKGFDLALEAFALVRERFPHAHMVIAGDGPELLALQQQAAELHVSTSVEFAGWVAPEAVPEWINGATLVVMPSRREGLPLVALEAAMMARPVVATRVGGLAEVVLHQQTGLLVDSGDTAALADAIAFLLDHPDRAAKMGRAARHRAEEVFGFKRHVDAYDALYRKLTVDRLTGS
jgi:glycogen(starch) synthase